MSQHGQRTLIATTRTTRTRRRNSGEPQSQSAVSPFVLVIAEGDSALHSVAVDAALTAASVIGALRAVRLRVCRADTSLTPPPPSSLSSADGSTADTADTDTPRPPSYRNVKDHSRPSSCRNVKDHRRRRVAADDASPLQRSASCVPPREAPAEDDEDEEGLLSRSLSDAPSGMFPAAKSPLHKGVARLLAPLDETAEEEMAWALADVWREAELDEQYKGAPRAVVVLISRRFMQQVGVLKKNSPVFCVEPKTISPPRLAGSSAARKKGGHSVWPYFVAKGRRLPLEEQWNGALISKKWAVLLLTL